MRIDLNNLPTDITLLQRLVRDLTDEVQIKRQTVDAQQNELKYHSLKIEKLEIELARLRGYRFGQSSEKISADQLSLWQNDIEEDIAERQSELDTHKSSTNDTPLEAKQAPKRQRPPEHLPRETQEHDLTDCDCPSCGQALHKIGEETIEQLDYRPASFFVRRHVKSKYACRHCENVTTAPMPSQPIEKGLPGAGLLAQVLTSKYCDHLPLYRQANIYQQRHDVTLNRSTLCDWVGRSVWLLHPIVAAMRPDLLKQPKLHTDDTPVPVLSPGRGKTRQGRLWVYLSDGNTGPPSVVYDYTPTRSQKGPLAWLADYEGYLQADAYPGYDALYKTGHVHEVACWAHARRQFTDIEKAGGSPLAREALLTIGKLYDIERMLREQNANIDTIQQVRQAQSVPILAEFKPWLDQQLLRLSNKSHLTKAMAYIAKRWVSFTRYTDDGRLSIDNNAAERAIRPLALGRKNWMFAGSDLGGQRAATLYSLVETCKLNNINPFHYLQDVLSRIADHPSHQIEELIPYNWQPLK